MWREQQPPRFVIETYRSWHQIGLEYANKQVLVTQRATRCILRPIQCSIVSLAPAPDLPHLHQVYAGAASSNETTPTVPFTPQQQDVRSLQRTRSAKAILATPHPRLSLATLPSRSRRKVKPSQKSSRPTSVNKMEQQPRSRLRRRNRTSQQRTRSRRRTK